MSAPLLVLAVGNPSRGDDALGPLLLERLQADGWDAAPPRRVPFPQRTRQGNQGPAALHQRPDE